MDPVRVYMGTMRIRLLDGCVRGVIGHVRLVMGLGSISVRVVLMGGSIPVGDVSTVWSGTLMPA